MSESKTTQSVIDKLRAYGIIISIPLIIGIGIYFFKKEIDLYKLKIDLKNEEIQQLKELQFDRVKEILEAQEDIYKRDINILQGKINQMLDPEEHTSEIKALQQQITDLETKINFIKQIARDAVKLAETRLGPNLRFVGIKPFKFHQFPSGNGYDIDSMFKGYIDQIDGLTYLTIQGQYDTKTLLVYSHIRYGQHSPMFYSFDSVDLRTATFQNSDLRGVDLSTVIIDSKTKLPKR